MSLRQTCVAVAMSGGVDSSVAALSLLLQGYAVFGITMEHFGESDDSTAPPPAGIPVSSAVQDAAMVCRHIGIRHEIVDLRAQFNTRVIESFVSEYLAGRTPNPCVLCNRTIKWGALLEYARNEGADLFATGHYARILHDPHSKRHLLIKAAYPEKDQSYALWALSQEQLALTLFPLGSMSKSKVREMAAEHQLPVAEKAESQDICFIQDENYRRFITDHLAKRGITIEEGEIITANGQKVGRHRGYPFYTIGQRKGLGLAMGHPVFVTAIDPATNRIVIGEKKDLLAEGLLAVNANWIAEATPKAATVVEARIRYKDPGYNAQLVEVTPTSFSLHFTEPRPAVTPGQSVVLYCGESILGGGIIAQALPLS